MRKITLPVLFSLFCINLSISQSSSQNFETWNLSAVPFNTSNNNVLDANSLNLQITSLEKVAEGADLQIDIQFIAALKQNRLGELQESRGTFYRILTTSPIFEATITNASKQQLLKKNYGGKSLERRFGENKAWTKEELSRNWNDIRSQFYQDLELKSLDVASFELDLNQLIGKKVVVSTSSPIPSLPPTSPPVSAPTALVIEDRKDRPVVTIDSPDNFTNNDGNDIEMGTAIENEPITEDENKKPVIDFNKYRFGQRRGGITFGGGLLPIEVSDGSIATRVIDDSPSQDNFTAFIDVQDQKRAAFFRIGLSGENMVKHRAWGLNFDFGFGKEEVSKFEASFDYGFLIGKGRVRIAPQLSFIGGASNISLGEMFQNDLFIEIGDTRFYSETVNLKYKNTFLGGGPKLQIALSLGKKLDLKLYGTYVYGISTGEKIKFTGSDEENVPARAVRKLPHPRVAYIINNLDDTTAERLFNFTGIKIGASLSFNQVK